RYRSKINGIAVGLGPGSYGGVRVGIAVANGLSLVLGIPVVGISSLEAWCTDRDDYTVLGDARRKTFFKAEVVGRTLEGEPELNAEESVKEQVSELIQSQDSCYVTADQKVSEIIPGVKLCYPVASHIAIRALGVSPSQWPSEAVLQPHYLRAPYITTPKAK
ncbi:MAG: tRNA (adenosine(37)-N6)-threonylcarbamoyltransferase complex dimerization subunit type 1 TsaB, partial [Verrucomicrobiota bacterium]